MRKVKTLPIAIGSKKQMQEDKESILRKHQGAKVILRKCKSRSAARQNFYQLRVSRRLYEKLRR